MSEEFLRPDTAPPADSQSIGRVGSLLSAIGILFLVPSLLGAAVFAAIWALGRLIGLPDWFMWPFFAAGGFLVLLATIWTVGRAWHVERRLENGVGVDEPVFRLFHYFGRSESE